MDMIAALIDSMEIITCCTPTSACACAKRELQESENMELVKAW